MRGKGILSTTGRDASARAVEAGSRLVRGPLALIDCGVSWGLLTSLLALAAVLQERVCLQCCNAGVCICGHNFPGAADALLQSRSGDGCVVGISAAQREV